MTIKTRILSLGVLAIASLLYILGNRFLAERRAHADSQQLLTQMVTAERLSSLVHELQKERGISAGFLVKPGNFIEPALDTQRAATSRARASLDDAALRNLENLATLANVRERILRRQMMPGDSFRYYTLTIMEVLDKIDDLAKNTNTAIRKNSLSAHSHLLYAKEHLAEIRGSLNESLSRGAVDDQGVSILNQQLGLHLHHSRMFLRDAAPGIADAFRAVLAEPKVRTTFEIIQAALAERAAVGSADEWFTTASYAIDRLWQVENQSIMRLRRQAQDEMAAAERRFLIEAVGTLGFSLLLIFLAVTAVSRLLRALNVLVSNIEHTINTQNFAHRIPYHSNDELGHGVGDTVLKEMAHLVQGILRTTDLLVRWGGEEFMILVPQNGYGAAATLAEKLRRAIESHHFPHKQKVTASFGVSEHAACDTLETPRARVDEALYRAKHEGRNRVCIELAKAGAGNSNP